MMLPPIDFMLYYSPPEVSRDLTSEMVVAREHLSQLYEACERYERGPSRKRTKAWNRYFHWVGRYGNRFRNMAAWDRLLLTY